jgi:demethoxyubiquinone hydroxylase (CLK1/Coq7/Cat5 family)
MHSNLHREATAKVVRKAANKAASITKLQECFRGELSAVETYQLALKSVPHVGLHHTLQEMLTSHARRTEQIGEKIERFGGVPPTSSGVWGAFAKALQAGADLLGDRAAILALEEGEDRLLKLYTEGLGDCNARTRALVDTELLPEQQRTHRLCEMLKSYVSAPS